MQHILKMCINDCVLQRIVFKKIVCVAHLKYFHEIYFGRSKIQLQKFRFYK